MQNIMEYVFSDRISALQPSAIREILKATADPAIIPFAAGNPDVAAFPVDDVRRISAKIFENEPITALQYGVTEGYEPLRKTVADYMKKKNNIGRDFDKLIITSGATQVMDLATKSLCNFGDIIVCENPSFIGSLNCFRSYGCKLKGVPVEEDGMDMNALEKVLKENKNVRFIYTINAVPGTTATFSLMARFTKSSISIFSGSSHQTNIPPSGRTYDTRSPSFSSIRSHIRVILRR